MKRTQKQVLWTSGGQFVCENAGLLSTGLLSSASSATPGPITESMGGGVSTSGGEPGGGPWIWQLPCSDPDEAENSGGSGAGALECSQIWFQLGCTWAGGRAGGVSACARVWGARRGRKWVNGADGAAWCQVDDCKVNKWNNLKHKAWYIHTHNAHTYQTQIVHATFYFALHGQVSFVNYRVAAGTHLQYFEVRAFIQLLDRADQYEALCDKKVRHTKMFMWGSLPNSALC